MGSSKTLPLRALPRFFVEEIGEEPEFLLPTDVYRQLHKVLRLGRGDQFVLLTGDGQAHRCELVGHNATLIESVVLTTESLRRTVLAQALPKFDKMDLIVRACTEIGVHEFWIFPSDRSVVKWTQEKFEEKKHRWEAVAKEAAELAFRAQLPQFTLFGSLAEVLKEAPNAVVLSEREDISQEMPLTPESEILIVGPEGGWSPREVELIGNRAVTLGPRVFRAETAAIAAVSLRLLSQGTL